MALKGKSTKKEKGRGFGLSTSKKLTEEGYKGNFVVISRKGFYGNYEMDSEKQKEIDGTLVYINILDKGESLNIYEYLA